MKIFSIYDLPSGKDRADLVVEVVPAGNRSPSELRAYCHADVRFYERGGTSEPRSPQRSEEMLVVMQGRGRIVVNRVEHPVRSGDVVIIGEADTYHAVADEADPFVVLTVAARIP